MRFHCLRVSQLTSNCEELIRMSPIVPATKEIKILLQQSQLRLIECQKRLLKFAMDTSICGKMRKHEKSPCGQWENYFPKVCEKTGMRLNRQLRQ